ncbi:hypothetical protein ACL7TT_08105 [Microbulbifer sp. 2304DJ12-6]|uniref:hypothetical protein n=1 Tax=Microbulbifer sp. 2304DJ12-6 TaxID=3233340 RepID=UPI0039B09CD3
MQSRRNGKAAVNHLKSKGLKPAAYITNQKCDLIDLYADQRIRRGIYCIACDHFIDRLCKEEQITYGKGTIPGLELQVFYDYAPNIFRDGDITPELLHEVPEKLLEFYKASPLYCDEYIVYASMVVHRATSELPLWEELSGENRQRLAEVFFCGATILGSDVFNEAVRKQPAIFNYFSHMAAFDYNYTLFTEEDLPRFDPSVQASTILELATRLKDDPTNEAVLGELITECQSHLSQMANYKPSISAVQLFVLWTGYLYRLAQLAEIPVFNEEDNNSAWILFNEAWLDHFQSTAIQDLAPERLIGKAKTCHYKAPAIREKIKTLDLKINEVKGEIDTLENESSSNRRKERELSRLNLQQSSLIDQMYVFCDAATLHFLPEGAEADLLYAETELSDPEIRDDFSNDSVMSALLAFHDWITEKHPGFNFSEVGEDGLENIAFPNFSFNKDADGTSAKDESLLAEHEPETELVPDNNHEPDPEADSLTDNGFTSYEHDPVDGDREEQANTSTDDELARAEENPIDIIETFLEELSPKIESAPAHEPKTEVVDDHEPTVDYSSWSELALGAKRELDDNIFISSYTANEVLSQLVLEGKLELACELSLRLEDANLSTDFLPFILFRAAYYGINTWDDRHRFNKARRVLNQINTSQLDSWASQHNGEIVPYLIFAASLQPVIFGGNASTATTLLRDIPQSLFDQHTRSLIKETIELANRSEPVTLADLRNSGKHASDRPVFNTDAIDSWEQRIKSQRRGYAPILKAQTQCIEQGIFGEVINIIRKGDRDGIPRVEFFVTKYDDIEESTGLLNESLSEVNYQEGEGISRVGRQRFHHKVSELIEIGKDWLAAVQFKQGSHAEEYSKRFPTRLDQAIDRFSTIAEKENGNLSSRAGATLVLSQLQTIKTAIAKPKAAWSYPRAKAWYYHPRMLMVMNDIKTEPRHEIEWMLSQLGQDLDLNDIYSEALKSHHLRLAYVVGQAIKDKTPNAKIEDLSPHFFEYKRQLAIRCSKLEGQVETALLAGLIDASKSEAYNDNISHLNDAIEQLEPLDDPAEITSSINQIDSILRALTASTKEALNSRFEDMLSRLRTVVTEDPVTDQWVSDMQAAIDNDNLPVAQEMLDELELAVEEKRRIKPLVFKDVGMLDEFVSKEKAIFMGISNCDKPNSVWHAVQEGEEKFGLDFSNCNRNNSLKKCIDIQDEWRIAKKPLTNIKKEFYDKIIIILASIGIKPTRTNYNGNMRDQLDYRRSTGFSSLMVRVGPSPSLRPFTLFGSSVEEKDLPVVVAYQPWTTEQLQEILVSNHIHGNVVLLISAVPMSSQQRNDFAAYCKQQQKTILHLDLVSLLFLFSQSSEGAENMEIRNFLWLTAPYTYFNPYEGTDASKPPLPEMRFGRELQIESLLRMDNGSAIVFGGRQLGKTTILQEVQSRFHRPAGKTYAKYEMLDKNLYGRMDVSKEAWDHAQGVIWNYLYQWLDREGMINKAADGKSIDSMISAVKDAIFTHKDAQFIAIFDEIDPILGVDSAHDFNIFRGLRDLVAHPEAVGRFKVIIGGLENVTRFENSPNYPLTQLGGSIQVSIMPTQEALHLVIEPLRAAGYRFANAHVANRILAITNRHPGLIQIFCHQLINYLSANRRADVGSVIINDEEITNVGKTKEVMSLIRKRFDMTLNLDQRYLVIIYSIIDDGRGSQPFGPAYAKEIAECWLPKAFANLSDKQFEAFLVELAGLGVLKQLGDGQYALRNTNVLKLLTDGHGDDVAVKLEEAIDNYNTHDPLDRHAFDPERSKVPSPITCRDEKAILGRANYQSPQAPLQEDKDKQVTVSIISGSEALGIKALQDTLPLLYSEEHKFGSGKKARTYEYLTLRVNNNTDYQDIRKKIVETHIQKKLLKSPQMIFLELSSNITLDRILGIIDTAHSCVEEIPSEGYPVRVVIVMGPGAYWQWVSNTDFTREREALQPFIKLAPWSSDAVKGLLDRLGINDSSDDQKAVIEMTGAWYFSLNILAQVSKDHPKWKELSQFVKKFTPLTAMTEKNANKFLEMSGVTEIDYALTLLEGIYDNYGDESVEADVIEVISDDIDYEGEKPKVSHLVQWLSDLNLLVRGRNTRGGDSQYSINSAMAHAIKLRLRHG